MKSPVEMTSPETSQDPEIRAGRQKTAYRISLATGILMVIVAIASIIISVVGNQTYLGAVISLVIGIAGLISAWFNRKGRVETGIWILVITLLATNPFTVMLSSGLGIVAGLLVIVTVSAVTVSTLPRSKALKAIIASVVVAVITIISDQFYQGSRSTVDPITAPAFIGVIGIAYSVYLFRQYRNLALRTKILAAFITVALLSGGVVAVAMQVTSSRTLNQTLGSGFEALAETQALAVGDLIDSQIDLISSLALDEKVIAYVSTANHVYQGSQEEIQNQIERYDQEWMDAVRIDKLDIPLIQSRVNWSPLSQQFRDFRGRFPDHIEIFVTDRYGAVLGATNVTSDYYQADEAWWQAAFKDGQGGIYIGTPEYDESAGGVAINLALPIRNYTNNSVDGVLRSTYRLEAIDKLILNEQIVGMGETDVLFPGEEIQAIHQSSLVMLDQETVVGLQASDEHVYTEIMYRGVPNLAVQVPIKSTSGNPVIDNLGWLVVLHQPTEVAMSPVIAQTRLSVLLVLLTIGLVSGLAIFISQFISGPIVQLASVAEEFGHGNLSARAKIESKDEIATLAESFNTMTGQLSTMLETLERRVAERTRGIELSADVSRRLSTILDQGQLVSEVVRLVREAFDYYHVHIYLFDDTKENLLMVGGTGEAGKTMLERGHKIPRGRGLVGRACESGQVVLVRDTSTDPNWLPNPLLPDTRSEIAVPIMLGDEVLGALDVQEDETEGLGQEDADLLLSIAGQVAIALRNARQYTEAQRQVDREARISTIVTQIQNTQSIEEALQVTVRELGRALRAPQTKVRVKLGEDEDGREQ